jgi:hypothetical protein
MNNCPSCSHELVNIIYGIPSEKLIQMARNEDVALGGTTLVLDQPKLYCYGCNEAFSTPQIHP